MFIVMKIVVREFNTMIITSKIIKRKFGKIKNIFFRSKKKKRLR